ncbi:BaeS Signal transduction histidine kinase [Rhabdaerophilaceae bacterium]
MFLNMLGRDVVVAENGQAGLAKLATAAFDIMIVDMEMPDITGLEVIRLARQRPELAELPIIMVTSRDDAMAIDRAYELGASSFVVKPVNWTLIDHYLRFVCRASRNEALARQAQIQAETLGRTKDNLFSILRHEIKTPLNAIIGFTKLAADAREGGDIEAMRSHLEAVQESGQRLLRSFADMSSYSDLISGRVVPACEPTSLSWIVDDVFDRTSQRLKQAGLVVERDDQAQDQKVSCDQSLLTTALTGIVENVLEHAKGATRVRFATHPNGKEAALSVCDDGPGIEPTALEGCLEPFLQADMSLARANQGLGLGLPIARVILALNGGRLEAISPPGEGLTVRFVLPMIA